MDTIILIVGLIISPLVTIVGLILNHRTNLKTAEVLALKTKSEAQKIEQEADEIEIKNRLAQLTYYVKIVEGLQVSVDRLQKEKIILETAVEELRKEKNILMDDNTILRQRVTMQEIEINTLREKVKILENKPM